MVLEVKDLSININQINLVEGVSFKINEGEIFSIIGESGSGKSITSLSILRLLEKIGTFRVNGSVFFQDKSDLLTMSKKDIRKIRGNDISVIFQDPMTALNPLHKIEKQLTEAIILHKKLSKKEIKQRIHELFDLMGLADQKEKLSSFPHEFSGGQRQRIMIVMALLNNPSLLIADEPTTALDVTTQQEILKIFRNLKEKANKSILLISHDLTLVKNIADKVAVMYNGKIVEQGTVKQIFNNPKHEYTKKLLLSEPRGSAISPKSDSVILEAKNLKIKYLKDKSIFGLNNKFTTAVENAGFRLKKGQSIGIVGESGSGKSSIAKAILKLVKAEGKIKFKDQNITPLSEKTFKPERKNIQIVFQDPHSSLNPRVTVKDIIKEGLQIHYSEETSETINLRIEEVMSKIGLDKNFENRYPHQLSGGQKQRVGLARSLVLKPEVLVLDEPTSALDLITQSEILTLLKQFQSESDLSYIFISHDLRVIKSICDYILVVKNGTIVEEGSVKNIFKGAKNEYTQKLIQSSFFEDI